MSKLAINSSVTTNFDFDELMFSSLLFVCNMLCDEYIITGKAHWVACAIATSPLREPLKLAADKVHFFDEIASQFGVFFASLF
jgi:hypothetical protein